MARLFYEQAWKSEKIDNVKPTAWRPEYAWLYSIAAADGTFESSPKLIWSAAYACVRPDWTVEMVAQLLDELERVGLLERRQAADGKTWGRWVGSEKFLPTEERCKTNRYRTGRRELFKSDGAATAQRQDSDGATTAQRPLGLGVGVGVEQGIEQGIELGSAAKDSENEQDKHKSIPNPKSKPVSDGEPLSPTPTPTPKTPRLRKVIPRQEYEEKRTEKEISDSQQETDRLVAEFKAELAAKPKPVFSEAETARMQKCLHISVSR